MELGPDVVAERDPWHLYLARASSRESEGLAGMLDLHAPPAIDAALPSAMPVPLTAELLADMQGRWS